MNSNFLDIKPVSLGDTLPEQLIKVYPYEFIFADKAKTFIQANTTSIATISQSKLNIEKNNLQQDDEGNYYFEMIAAITSNGVIRFININK